MRALAFILTQYVALCGAMTQSPNIWPSQGLSGPTTDPLFGSWWGNQHNFNFDQLFGPPTNPLTNNIVPLDVPNTLATEPTLSTLPTSPSPPTAPSTTPPLDPPTTVMTYDTATPAVQTMLTVQEVPPASVKTNAEASISLQELIGLAANNANGKPNSQATNLFLKMLGTMTSKDTPSPTKQSSPEYTNQTSATKQEKTVPAQAIVSTSPATAAQEVNEAKNAPTVTTTTSAPPTFKPTTTTAPPTTTTRAPTTTAAPKTAPQIATVPTVPTVKPLVKMTLGEILKLSKINLPALIQPKAPEPTTTTTTPRPRGCHYKGHFYEPLAEIERGQTGSWCYGSYCNHKGTVIHWDDHNCATSPPTPPTAQKSQVEPPAVDVSVVAGALTPAEIDALATVPGMKGIAETLRQHGQHSNTVVDTPARVDLTPPSLGMPSVNAGMMPSMSFNGAGNGMNGMMGAGMNGMMGMDGMGGAGMSDMGGGGLGDPNMLALARMAGIELPSLGGSVGGGEMGSMGGGMGGMGGMGGAGGGNMAELAAMAGLDIGGMSGLGAAGLGGGMGAAVGGGCFVNGRHYAPGTDIENHRDFGRCYGTYCDFNSQVVNWNDRCRATMSPLAMAPRQPTMSMRQLQQLDLI